MYKVGVLPCSGACNVGMMTAKTTVDMCEEFENVGFVCALGLPLGIPSIIANGKKLDRNIAVNGCEMRCATKSLEAAALPVDREVVLTGDFHLKKTKSFKDEEGLDRVKERVRALVQELSE